MVKQHCRLVFLTYGSLRLFEDDFTADTKLSQELKESVAHSFSSLHKTFKILNEMTKKS